MIIVDCGLAEDKARDAKPSFGTSPLGIPTLCAVRLPGPRQCRGIIVRGIVKRAGSDQDHSVLAMKLAYRAPGAAEA